MKIKPFIVFVLICTAFSACSHTPETRLSVREHSGMPDGGRAAARACVLDGKAYVFAGRDSAGNYLNDLWAYEPASDTWTMVSRCPGRKRVNAVITAHNGALYMGLGYAAKRAYNDSAYLRDWWQYTPATNQWTQRAPFPSPFTIAPTPAVDGDNIYLFYGCGHMMSKEVWRYDTQRDEWISVPAPQDRHRQAFGCTGAAISGTLYFGTGFNSNNLTDWYSVDLAGNTWTQRATLPGKGREFAASTATDEYVYLFGGQFFAGDLTGGEIFETYLRYTPATDQWTWCGTMPCGRAENQIAFTLNGKAWFGLGEDEHEKMINKLYCIE
ncbi:MAG: hypothetical protein IKQ48_04250 [Paludibacteraceae bacterium]|nr:hypothetical protein [Paludibacteraceae bacterium]MBR4263769.1 hypothetical protein [Paludibacteraceae bacterium]